MRHSGLLVLALAGCVAPDAGLSEAEQAEWDGSDWDRDGEIIIIEDSFDPCWDAGLCWPGAWPEDPAPPTGPEIPGGGGPGPGGGGGGPGPQPDRKQCFPTIPDEICLDCCYYNYDHVDGWKCRQHKQGSKKYKNCWAEAADKLGDCQANTCSRHASRPILTGAMTTWITEEP